MGESRPPDRYFRKLVRVVSDRDPGDGHLFTDPWLEREHQPDEAAELGVR